MAQALSVLPLTAESQVRAGSVHVGFVVDKVALGQASLRVLRFSPVNIIPPWLSILIYQLGDEQRSRWLSQIRDIVSLHRHEHNKK
jgi:hypothetical protein